jgi:hypothetical protein
MALDDDDPVEVYRREIATVSPLTKKEELASSNNRNNRVSGEKLPKGV